MSKPRPTSRRTNADAKTQPPDLAKQLRIVLAAALFAGAVTAVLVGWEHLFPTPPERLVKIYRTHGCRCAFNLADSLKSEGFVVRLYEHDTLEHVRGTLRTPANLRGCHVGEFLGYFLEGHVAPAAVRKLAQREPVALGLATERSVDTESGHVAIERDENSRVMLVEQDGRVRLWFEPPSGPKE